MCSEIIYGTSLWQVMCKELGVETLIQHGKFNETGYQESKSVEKLDNFQ